MFFLEGQPDAFGRLLGRTVAVSLLLHLGVLLLALGFRFTQRGEAPLASVQVSLVSMPAMSRPVEASLPRPAPVRPPAPAALPKSASPPAPARRASGDVMRDVLRGIQLPPDAPKLGDLSPSKPIAEPQRPEVAKVERSNDKLRKDVESLLGKLKVPEARSSVDLPVEQTKPVPPQPDRSFSDEVDRELEKELKKLQAPPPVRKPPELVKDTKLQAQEAPSRPAPVVTAKVPNVKAPDTTLKVPGSSAGSSPYLARVQALISSRWAAPPVDVSGQSLAVVIRFRLDRSGKVSGVTVERSSGNDYFDVAGQRAVISAAPLPAFPADMTDSSLDAHFTFTVGEQAG